MNPSLSERQTSTSVDDDTTTMPQTASISRGMFNSDWDGASFRTFDFDSSSICSPKENELTCKNCYYICTTLVCPLCGTFNCLPSGTKVPTAPSNYETVIPELAPEIAAPVVIKKKKKLNRTKTLGNSRIRKSRENTPLTPNYEELHDNEELMSFPEEFMVLPNTSSLFVVPVIPVTPEPQRRKPRQSETGASSESPKQRKRLDCPPLKAEVDEAPARFLVDQSAFTREIIESNVPLRGTLSPLRQGFRDGLETSRGPLKMKPNETTPAVIHDGSSDWNDWGRMMPRRDDGTVTDYFTNSEVTVNALQEEPNVNNDTDGEHVRGRMVPRLDRGTTDVITVAQITVADLQEEPQVSNGDRGDNNRDLMLPLQMSNGARDDNVRGLMLPLHDGGTISNCFYMPEDLATELQHKPQVNHNENDERIRAMMIPRSDRVKTNAFTVPEVTSAVSPANPQVNSRSTLSREDSFLAWSEEERNRPWHCKACTFQNENALHLSCAVCGVLRGRELETGMPRIDEQGQFIDDLHEDSQLAAIRVRSQEVEKEWFAKVQEHRMDELLKLQTMALEDFNLHGFCPSYDGVSR